MYQSRQRIGGKTEYAVEKKFERRAGGRKGLSPLPPSQSDGSDGDESPSNAKRAIMGQSRRAERRSLGVGWTDARMCRPRPPAFQRPKQSAFPPPSSSFLALRGTRNKDIAPSIEKDRERESAVTKEFGSDSLPACLLARLLGPSSHREGFCAQEEKGRRTATLRSGSKANLPLHVTKFGRSRRGEDLQGRDGRKC